MSDSSSLSRPLSLLIYRATVTYAVSSDRSTVGLTPCQPRAWLRRQNSSIWSLLMRSLPSRGHNVHGNTTSRSS